MEVLLFYFIVFAKSGIFKIRPLFESNICHKGSYFSSSSSLLKITIELLAAVAAVELKRRKFSSAVVGGAANNGVTPLEAAGR